MWKYFTQKGTYKWIDVLQDLVNNYNRSYHRSIGCSPVEVSHNNEQQVWNRLYHEPGSKKEEKFVVGDHVRISKFKQTFDKGYLPNWTEEMFVLSQCVMRTPKPAYRLKDLQNEPILGTFYSDELQKIQ